MNEIPLIDLTPARLGGEAGEREVAKQIDRACREIGFFTLHGHGIDKAVFDDAHALLKAFFALPLSVKLSCKLPNFTLEKDKWTPYGYSGLLEENAYAHMGQQGKPSDYVEKFSAGRLVLDDEEPLPFVADEGGRRLRQSLKAYFKACHSLSARVIELFTVALGLPRDFFAKRIDQSNDSMRGHYYPGFTHDFANDQGMAEHTDSTLISLLTHTAPGIEVRTRADKWTPAPFQSHDQFLINIGDLMAHWTNGEYVSTPHRVVLCKEPRQSIAFFKLTNEDEMVKFGNKQMDALFQRDSAVTP